MRNPFTADKKNERKEEPLDADLPEVAREDAAPGGPTQDLSLARTLLLSASATLASLSLGFAYHTVTVNLNLLAEDLKISEGDLQWASNAYLLGLGCISLISGRAADILAASTGFIYVTKVVKPAEVAVASACLQFWSIFGGACGAAFSTLIYTNVGDLDVRLLGDTDDQGFKDNVLRGLRASHWFWAGLCFFAAIMTMILLRDSDSPEAMEAEEDIQAESDPEGRVAAEKAKESPQDGSGKPESRGMDIKRR